MERSIRFRLNETLHEIRLSGERLALDWIRGEAGLKGTKEGCREGDCGACLVLLGGLTGPAGASAPEAGGGMEWYSATACTLALSDLDGRHVITIEGLAQAGLTPVMSAMLDEGASQCGFCSPGFVLALTGFLVSGRHIDPVAAMTAVEGNLCRCTGYGSIRRAAVRLALEFADLPDDLPGRLAELGRRGVLPPSLAALMLAAPPPAARPPSPSTPGAATAATAASAATVIGGGTDYFVRHPDPEPGLQTVLVDQTPAARRIESLQADGADWLELGAAVTTSQFFASAAVQALVPGIERFADEIASPPIRNRATLAGNIANASPIADLTAMLLALDACLVLVGPAGARRLLRLDQFFLAYKKIDLQPGEAIAAIRLPAEPVRFNFEKVARRARLDIASANSALAVRLDGEGRIRQAVCSAGGIAAVPLRLAEVEALLTDALPSVELFREAGRLAAAAGTPQDDVRGSSVYRRRLLERFMWAHAIRLWPQLKLEKALFS